MKAAPPTFQKLVVDWVVWTKDDPMNKVARERFEFWLDFMSKAYKRIVHVSALFEQTRLEAKQRLRIERSCGDGLGLSLIHT